MSDWTQLGSNITGLNSDVAISADGRKLVASDAGANSNSGLVQVWEYVNNAWSQKGTTLNGPAADSVGAYYWGMAVGISDDGNTIAFTTYYHGYVYIYDWVNNAWSLTTTLQLPQYNHVGYNINYGAHSIGLTLTGDGTHLVIGPRLTKTVKVFQKVSGTWSQKGSDIVPSATDRAGRYVDIAADGNTVIFGDERAASYTGSFHVYEYVNNAWSQKGSVINGSAAGDYFGQAVSISSDGTTVACASTRNDDVATNSGEVKVYRYTNNAWTQIGADIQGLDVDDKVGLQIKLSSDGNDIAISAYDYNSNTATNDFRVDVFTYNSGSNTWSQKGSSLAGYSNVAIDSDADTIAVADSTNGIVKVFEFPSVSYVNVPTFTSESSDTVSSTSISTQDLTDTTIIGTTVVQKRTFTKNAVIKMFDKDTSAVSGKQLILKAGAALPGFSDSLTQDTILLDGRSSITLQKSEMVNKAFYIPMAVGSTVTLSSFSDTVAVNQTGSTSFTLTYAAGSVNKSTGDTFIYDGLTILLGSLNVVLAEEIVCFKEGTKITCLDEETQEEKDICIEKMKPDMYVKTYKHGYIRVKKIVNTIISNPKDTHRTQNRLYICNPFQYDDLKESLIMTGCHSILTDTITDVQRTLMTENVGQIYVTDDKYRLMTMYDDRAQPYTEEGDHVIWHLCLDHHDREMNYGIYANGLLVESCSERNVDLSCLENNP